MDLYTAVTDAYLKGDNDFNGKIEKITISVKPDALKTAPETMPMAD